MPRFYLPPDQCTKPPLFLTGREAHHAIHVLRLRRGGEVTVLNGAGAEFRCEVQEYDRDKVKLDRKSTRLNSSHVSISYAVFCLKKKRMPTASLRTFST